MVRARWSGLVLERQDQNCQAVTPDSLLTHSVLVVRETPNSSKVHSGVEAHEAKSHNRFATLELTLCHVNAPNRCHTGQRRTRGTKRKTPPAAEYPSAIALGGQHRAKDRGRAFLRPSTQAQSLWAANTGHQHGPIQGLQLMVGLANSPECPLQLGPPQLDLHESERSSWPMHGPWSPHPSIL